MSNYEPIDFGDRGYIELDDETDPNFIGSHISFGQYMRGEYEQEEQEDMNLE